MSRVSYGGIERRATVRLENYWLSLRRSTAGPFFSDFEPARNPIPWSRCFIAAAQGETWFFDHLGRELTAIFFDGAGSADHDRIVATIEACFGDMRAALATGRPVKSEGCRAAHTGATILYRTILLPFVDQNRHPAYVLGAASYGYQAKILSMQTVVGHPRPDVSVAGKSGYAGN